MASTDDQLNINDLYCAHNYSPLPVVLCEGSGVWVTDIEGKRYLDVHSAYSGINFGHSHPKLLAAAKSQLEKLTLTSRAFLSDQLGPFCKELAELCKMEMALPMNSGVEAVETGIKLARKWGYETKGIPEDKAEIICFQDNFHGRTITVISFSDSESSRKGYGPYTAGFHVVPYGGLDSVKRVINSNTAAILFEPIQGEAGIIVPPEGFLRGLRQLASEHNVLLMADEIQTGFCRTGDLFACDYEGVTPDVYLLGKSLGGGIVPLSAVVSSREILSVFTPGSHGSTFSGNPFACAIGRAVINLIKAEKFESRSKELGSYLIEQLQRATLSKVEAIRGRGLFVGIDLHHHVGKGKEVCKLLMKEGILCKDTRDYSIRIAPPLVITKEELNWGIERLIRVLS